VVAKTLVVLGFFIAMPQYAIAADEAEQQEVARKACAPVLKSYNYAPLSRAEAEKKCTDFILSDTRLMPFYKFDVCRGEQRALGRSAADINKICARYAGGGLAIKIASARVKEKMPNRPWKDWPPR